MSGTYKGREGHTNEERNIQRKSGTYEGRVEHTKEGWNIQRWEEHTKEGTYIKGGADIQRKGHI